MPRRDDMWLDDEPVRGSLTLSEAAKLLTDAVRANGHAIRVADVMALVRRGTLAPATVTRESVEQVLAVWRRNAHRQRTEHHGIHHTGDD